MNTYILCEGDRFLCTEGTSHCKMKVTSQNNVFAEGRKIATQKDAKVVNLSGFGQCRSLQNPTVAAATAAANGVLQPQNCIPVFFGGWSDTDNAVIDGAAMLRAESKIKCAYAGEIKAQTSEQKKVKN